jgi:SAM-dependent methyltransferase
MSRDSLVDRVGTPAHKSRFANILEMTPPGDPSQSALAMVAHKQILASLKFQLGYGTVRGCDHGPSGHTDSKTITAQSGESYQCKVDLFDPEKDTYPYSDASFDTVLCCELIEHLSSDPMHMMSETNRILKTGGHFVLATPNIGSLRSISAILLGHHPGFSTRYTRPRAQHEDLEPRHNREYVTMEIHHLFADAGLTLVDIRPGSFLDEPNSEFEWITPMLKKYNLNHEIRGDGIYAVARKSGPVKNRWPSWLYA